MEQQTYLTQMHRNKKINVLRFQWKEKKYDSLIDTSWRIVQHMSHFILAKLGQFWSVLDDLSLGNKKSN